MIYLHAGHSASVSSLKPPAIQFLTSGAIFAVVTYLPLFARDELGLSDFDIGLIVSLCATAMLLSNFLFGRAADIYGRRLFLWVGLLVSSLSLLLLLMARDYPTLALARFLNGFCFGIFPSALIAHVHDTKGKMGKFSAWGSLGWGFGTMVGGIVASSYFAVRGVFVLSSLIFLLCFVIALFMKVPTEKRLKVPLFPTRLLKRNACVYVPVVVRHSGAFMIWTFWPLFLAQLGANVFWIGVIQAINALTQFAVMFFLTDRIKSTTLIFSGIAISGVTFLSFTMVNDFWQIMPTQILLGISWSFMYVGALRYVTEMNPEKATVSGLLNSFLNLSAVLGPVMASAVISIFQGDYRATMYLAAFMTIPSLLVFAFLRKREERMLDSERRMKRMD